MQGLIIKIIILTPPSFHVKMDHINDYIIFVLGLLEEVEIVVKV